MIKRLDEVFPNDDHKNRGIWRAYLPHVYHALDCKLVGEDKKGRITLIWRYGDSLYSHGRWNEAEGVFGQVMDILKRVLGAEHPDKLIAPRIDQQSQNCYSNGFQLSLQASRLSCALMMCDVTHVHSIS